MRNASTNDYEARFPSLVMVARQLEISLNRYLSSMPRVDRISARAKTPESFRNKAGMIDASGAKKYAAPLEQIQDQIAGRIVVFYESDVRSAAGVLERYFRTLERREHVPDSYWEFGYFGRHWIFALPDDVIPADISKLLVPRFFELQVKTLFQHAWSEANHDLGYKPSKTLTADQQRRFAFTAAQAWGADRVFNELSDELAGS